MNEHPLHEIIRFCESSGRLAITAHDRPDGDALGATLGLFRILMDRGIPCVLVGCHPIPERYAFLLQGESYLAPETPLQDVADALVVLDTGMPSRSTPLTQALEKNMPVLNIDHHASNSHFGTFNWVEADKSSSSEMISTLADEAKWPVSAEAAEALYAGLVTDTGRFAYENTSPSALHCAARLLGQGAIPYKLNQLLYDTVPEAELRLNGIAINSLRLHENGAIAVVSLSREDYAKFGCGPEMSGEAINLPRRIEGVRVALFLYEPPAESYTKISIRTEAPFDAVAVAKMFGGGGHTRAAGGQFNGRIPEAEEAVMIVIRSLWAFH